jgi:hypothetical protein
MRPRGFHRRYLTLDRMIRRIAPQFFATDIPRTITWYVDKLSFACLGTWPEASDNPPVYAMVAASWPVPEAEPPVPAGSGIVRAMCS